MSSEGIPTTRLGDERERWEYRVGLIQVAGLLGPKIDVDEIGAYLNQAGDDGWEAVSIVAVNYNQGATSEMLITFKRRA